MMNKKMNSENPCYERLAGGGAAPKRYKIGRHSEGETRRVCSMSFRGEILYR